MSNLTDFIAGGGSQQIAQYKIFTTSGSITVENDGVALILAVGGGGSSGWGSGGAGSYYATGGGAGERAFDIYPVNAGDVLTTVIGAGGSPPGGAPGNGNSGTYTAVSITGGYYFTVNGGSGGSYGTTTVSGGAGGTGGSGGSSNIIRRIGGRGGNISGYGAALRLCTGGGGVNLLHATNSSSSCRGGDINYNGFTVSNGHGTGGGGVGGHGGDILTNKTLPTGTAGGGAGGDASNPSSTGASIATDVGRDIFGQFATYSGNSSFAPISILNLVGIQAIYSGGYRVAANSAANAGGFGGGETGYEYGAGQTASTNKTNPFGGGGGHPGNGGTAYSSLPGWGAGSGGTCNVPSIATIYPRSGGQGVVLVAILRAIQ